MFLTVPPYFDLPPRKYDILFWQFGRFSALKASISDIETVLTLITIFF
jgi:hypothetical protein